MMEFPKNLSQFTKHFLRPYKGYLIIMIIAFIYVALDATIQPYVLKLFIDKAIESFGKKDFLSACMLPGGLLIVLCFTMNLASRINNYVSLKSLPTLKSDIISEAADYVRKHSFNFLQDNLSGSISNKISDLANNAEALLLTGRDLLKQSVTIISCVLITLITHPYFSILFLTWTILFIITSTIICKHIQPFATSYAEIRSKSFGNIVDTLINAINVLRFAREEYEQKYLKRLLDEMVEKDTTLQWKFFHFGLIMSGIALSMQVITVILLLYLGSKGLLTGGDFAFIFLISVNITNQAWIFTENLIKYSEQRGFFNQALELLSTPYNIPVDPNAATLKVDKGTIVFTRVHFYYSKSQKLFEDNTIVIHGGEKVGLVGETGGGKTTFVNLIIRLFDVQKGDILIDGQSIRSISLKSLRENIAFIPQDSTLFHRSLMENIRYGKITASDEEVIEAAKKAHADEFISKMHHGYHTLVGEGGVKLSSGQRQRIVIARAILKNASILILDEATSSLDSVTESLIQESLHYAMKDKTVIVIAHRLSTIQSMDRIIVFHKGRVVEEGTHEELLTKGPFYQEVWKIQKGP